MGVLAGVTRQKSYQKFSIYSKRHRALFEASYPVLTCKIGSFGLRQNHSLEYGRAHGRALPIKGSALSWEKKFEAPNLA
jgi:hypothetical protein